MRTMYQKEFSYYDSIHSGGKEEIAPTALRHLLGRFFVTETEDSSSVVTNIYLKEEKYHTEILSIIRRVGLGNIINLMKNLGMHKDFYKELLRCVNEIGDPVKIYFVENYKDVSKIIDTAIEKLARGNKHLISKIELVVAQSWWNYDAHYYDEFEDHLESLSDNIRNDHWRSVLTTLTPVKTRELKPLLKESGYLRG